MPSKIKPAQTASRITRPIRRTARTPGAAGSPDPDKARLALPVAGGLDQCPDPLGRGGDVYVFDAELAQRVADGIGNCRAGDGGSTQLPRGTISPISSASVMNSPGASNPRRGCCQHTSCGAAKRRSC